MTQLGGTTASNHFWFDYYGTNANAQDKFLGLSDMIFQPADSMFGSPQVVPAGLQVINSGSFMSSCVNPRVVNMSNALNNSATQDTCFLGNNPNFTDRTGTSQSWLACGIKLVSGILKNSRYVPRRVCFIC